MDEPLIILNFKTYREVEGARAMELARICERVASETGITIAVCPPAIELSRIASEVEIPVLSQHADISRSDPRTGSVTIPGIKATGAVGTLINHSERRLNLADIEDLVRGCREAGLVSIVCTNNVSTSLAAALTGPDYIAMEPPELIGGDISVTSADPGIVKGTVVGISRVSPEVKVLTGAGVKTGEDVRVALELGTVGVLLASGVVKASDPGKALISLCSGISK